MIHMTRTKWIEFRFWGRMPGVGLLKTHFFSISEL